MRLSQTRRRSSWSTISAPVPLAPPAPMLAPARPSRRPAFAARVQTVSRPLGVEARRGWASAGAATEVGARTPEGPTKRATWRQPSQRTLAPEPDWEVMARPLAARRGTGRRALFKFIGAVGAFGLVAAGIVAAIGPSLGLISHASAPPNPDCTLVLPANPLSAQGLATPYQLVASDPDHGACREDNQAQMAFAQAAVLDPATGALAIYDPLVVTRGKAPAAAPVVPHLPANAVVALWFGFNGTNLRLRGTGTGDLAAAHCVNGLPGSIFGQVSYCNAVQFFTMANALIQAHKIMPPALGTGTDGQICPTVRDFSVVDQDQSDNVTTAYLVTEQGRTAQNTTANAAALATTEGARTVGNGSDNGLLVALDHALGCTPWMVPDLADPGKLATGLPLNELQAAMYQAAPIATVPIRDPMTLAEQDLSLTKLNLYRAGVDQGLVVSVAQARQDQVTYCQQLFAIAPARLKRDQALTQVAASPVPLAANNLFTFLAQRFNFTVSKQGLGCEELVEQRSPITLKMNERGVVVEATIRLPQVTPPQPAPPTPAATPVPTVTVTATAPPAAPMPPIPAPTPAGTPTPGASSGGGDRHHHGK